MEAPVVEQAPVTRLPVVALAGPNWVMVDRARFVKVVEGLSDATDYAKLILDEVNGLLSEAS